MFNVGGGELLVILLLALIVLGPQRLPGAARQLGRAVGEIRRLSSGFQSELRAALDESDEPPRLPPLGPVDADGSQPIDTAPRPGAVVDPAGDSGDGGDARAAS
jgi:sec-independent protein translocase protein TatB